MLSCLRSITLRFSERMSVQYRIEMCYAYGGPQGTCCKLKTPLFPFPLLTSQFASYLLSKRLMEYATSSPLKMASTVSVQYRIEMCYAYGGPQGTCCKLKTPLFPFPLLTSQFASYLLSKRLMEYATSSPLKMASTVFHQ